MEYKLKNGKTLTIEQTQPSDAAEIIALISAADEESRFLAREPGEFNLSVEAETAYLESSQKNPKMVNFTARIDGVAVGQCSVMPIARYRRFRHRAELAMMVRSAYQGMGIGGKLMQTCLDWCREHGITQAELGVMTGNTKAIKMYMDFGFKVVGNIPDAMHYADGSYTDEYTMVKSI